MPRMNRLGTGEPSSDPRYRNSEPSGLAHQEQSFHAAGYQNELLIDAALVLGAQGELRPARDSKCRWNDRPFS